MQYRSSTGPQLLDLIAVSSQAFYQNGSLSGPNTEYDDGICNVEQNLGMVNALLGPICTSLLVSLAIITR